VAALLLPTGMVSVLNGSIDDGYGGVLGWVWGSCALTTIGLVVVTRAALKERQYSAVMAATGLLYLAILTAFGTDLVARAVLACPSPPTRPTRVAQVATVTRGGPRLAFRHASADVERRDQLRAGHHPD